MTFVFLQLTDHGRLGPPGQPAAQTVCIINEGPAVTLNLGMEVYTARVGIRPAHFALEGCAEENLEMTRPKTHGQKMVSNLCETIFHQCNPNLKL